MLSSVTPLAPLVPLPSRFYLFKGWIGISRYKYWFYITETKNTTLRYLFLTVTASELPPEKNTHS